MLDNIKCVYCNKTSPKEEWTIRYVPNILVGESRVVKCPKCGRESRLN